LRILVSRAHHRIELLIIEGVQGPVVTVWRSFFWFDAVSKALRASLFDDFSFGIGAAR